MVNQARGIIIAAAMLLLSPAASYAVSFDLTSVAAGVWTYTLTYDPLDNYSIFQSSTTITVSNLSGVTGASGPTSTDYIPTGGFGDLLNLNWTSQVLDGGTRVVWTHTGGGTGNFSEAKHVFGFSIFAAGAVTGSAVVVTDGFSRDIGNSLPDGTFDLDINEAVAGPVTVPEPSTVILVLGGGVLLARRRRVLHGRT